MKRIISGAVILMGAWVVARAAMGQMPPPLTSDLEWRGRIVVEFAAELGDIRVNHVDGTALLGDDNLDALARQFGVFEIQPAIPGSQKPSNIEIRDLSRFYILEFPLEVDLHEVVQAYAAEFNVIIAEPYYVRRCDYTPNDPLFPQQWALDITDAEIAYDYCQGSDSVIVGFVDSGIDTAHEDLRDNLWVNPGEDLNGNGIIEPAEWNGIDDDHNGHIDDFWGWNVWQNNNNVQDSLGGHGTACAGCASAVTDNGVGISSLGWKAKIMTVKAGDGQFIYASAAGINYLAENGANVISLSYGGSYYSPVEAAAVANAWQQGCIIVASAGSDVGPYPVYPAAYDHVEGVAATDADDHKASFSNFGSWIDVCAPGVNILTTIPGNNYTSWSGTSFSAPIMGGLAGLVWAAAPSFTNEEVLRQIYSTCVNIDSLNPGYQGMLGHGRIDAGAAVSSMFPNLQFIEITLDDGAGNNNGRPDPGETVNLIFTLEDTNSVVGGTDVNVTLTCADPDVGITQGNNSFPVIQPGGVVSNNANPMVFSVNPSALPHEATFILTATEPTLITPVVHQFVQMLGRPDVVVIDDDDGANFQQYYDADLDSFEIVHDIWDVNTLGEIPQSELILYPKAIWHTSNAASPLSQAEQVLIAYFLSQGGDLFLTGEDIDEQLRGTPFYANVLHSVSEETNGAPQLSGVAGDPISNGDLLYLIGPGGAGNNYSPEAIAAGSSASVVYTYNNSGLGAGIRWSGMGKLVYFAFNFEAVSNLSTPIRRAVLNNVLNWFSIVGVEQNIVPSLPKAYALLQNYPNPFNPFTAASFELPVASHVNLGVYDTAGRSAATLVNGWREAGSHEVMFDGSGLASGVYILRLKAGGQETSQKVVLLR